VGFRAGDVGRSWRALAAPTLACALMLASVAANAEDPASYQRETLQWEGEQRSYLLHVPPGTGTAPLPLVVALHGAGGNAADFARETQFAPAADAENMLLVVPDGTGETPDKLGWNAHICCGVALWQKLDDVGFVGALIDHVAAEEPVDRARVYAAGMSNGAMLAYQIAAAHPSWLAAIAPVSGTIGGTDRDGNRFVIEKPQMPVPVMIIHGRKDSYVLFDGGSSRNLPFPKRSNMAVADALAFWSDADGCGTAPAMMEPVPGKLRRTAFLDCRAGSDVILWEIETGEHEWPTIAFPAPGGGTRSTAAEILAFFAAHSRE